MSYPQQQVSIQAQHQQKEPITTRFGAAFGFGITHIIIGVLVFFLQCPVTTDGYPSIIGTGFWCGILFIITGAIGIVTYKKRSRNYYTTFMILSIVSIIFAIILYLTVEVDIYTKQDNSVRIPILVALAFLSFIHFVITIVTSGVACCGLYDCCGCCRPVMVVPQQPTYQYMNTPSGPQLVAIQIGPSGGVYYQQQTPMMPGMQQTQYMTAPDNKAYPEAYPPVDNDPTPGV